MIDSEDFNSDTNQDNVGGEIFQGFISNNISNKI